MDHITGRQVWRGRVDDFRKSGLSVLAWCQQNGYTRDKVRYWLKKYPISSSVAPVEVPQWLPVNVDEVCPVQRERPSLIVRISGAEIKVVSGFDPELLRSVVNALGRQSC